MGFVGSVIYNIIQNDRVDFQTVRRGFVGSVIINIIYII